MKGTGGALAALSVLLVLGCSAGGSGGDSTSPALKTPEPAAVRTSQPPPADPRDSQGCRYVRTSLPAPKGLPHIGTRGSDGSGRIVGAASGAHRSAPVLWRAGRATVLATPGGRSGTALDVNRSGTVVGQVSRPSGQYTDGYLWRDGRPVRLGGGGKPSEINDAGLIVGSARIDGRRRVVYWTASDPGTRHVVGGPDDLPGDLSVRGLDESGRIVGVGTINTITLTSISTTEYAFTGSVDGLQEMPGIPISLGASDAQDVSGGRVIGHGSYPGHSVTLGAAYQTSWRWDGTRYVALPPGVVGQAINADGVVAATDERWEVPLVVDPVTNRVVELPVPGGRWSATVIDVLDDGSVLGAFTSSGGDEDLGWTGVWQRRC